MNAAALLRLVLVLIVLPPSLGMMSRLRDVPGLAFFRAGFAVMCFSYAAAVLEDVWLEQVFNALQHLSVGVAGVLAVAGVVAWIRGTSALEGRS